MDVYWCILSAFWMIIVIYCLSSQALKTLNLTTFRNLVQQTFLQQGSALQAGGEGEQSDFVKPKSYPLIIQGFRTNSLDSDAHILFFDTESLISKIYFFIEVLEFLWQKMSKRLCCPHVASS